MPETFDYSKAKHAREVLAPAKQKERLQLAIALAVVAILAAGYVIQYVPRWW